MADKAWVTLATNDTYALGALVLAHSLKKVNTAYKLVVLISSNVTVAMRGSLQSVFDEVKEVNILDSGDAGNLRLLARPELGITFTKLHSWKLTQYEKCVFLDADTLVLQNCDELFEREELSAAPDVGWPDCFNSGVFVFKPSEETFKALYEFAIAHGSFDGGDQGLLNMFFSDWATSDASKRLPFLYNLSSAAIYSYLPAFKWYGKGVKIVHFIGNSKPWTQPFNSSTRTVEATAGSSHLQNFLQYWWDLFCACVYQQLSPEMAGLANTLSQIKLEEPTPEQQAREDYLRRQNWEQGNIDYMGKDSFSNIWDKISQTMNFEPEEAAPSTEASPAPTASLVSSAPPAESSAKVESPVPEVCPLKPSEQPIVCPKPSKPSVPEPAPSTPAVEPAAPKAPAVAPAAPLAPAVAPSVPAVVPSVPAAASAPVAPVAVAQTPSKPAPAAAPVPAPKVEQSQVPSKQETVVEKPPSSAQDSPVCQKPVAAKEQAEPSSPVPVQDPKSKPAAKPSGSKKK